MTLKSKEKNHQNIIITTWSDSQNKHALGKIRYKMPKIFVFVNIDKSKTIYLFYIQKWMLARVCTDCNGVFRDWFGLEN